MGGKVLTLPSDLIREGCEEGIAFGINQGRLNEIFSSVQDGDYPIARGAQKAEMSIEQLKKQWPQPDMGVSQSLCKPSN